MALALLVLLVLARPAPAQELLAATPDANAGDRYVVEKAAELGHDPAAIFAFVRDQIGYHAYFGSLRGARGTLWAGAGNALDKANLLVALLRASGVPARYARGTLPEGLARDLVLSMFPPQPRVLGCLDPQTERSDPAHDAALLEIARAHFWVQLDTGGGFQDADPTIAGASLGQSFAAVEGSFAEVPDELRHQVLVRVKRELTTPAVALFTGGGPAQDVATVLDLQFVAAEAVGKSLSVGHFVQTSGIGAVIPTITNRYSPYFLFNERDGDLATAPILRGRDYQEVLTSLPFGSQILTGVFLEIELLIPEPDGAQRSDLIEKTLVDRIGYAARRSGTGTVDLQVGIDSPAALSELDVVSLDISTAPQPREPLVLQEAALATLASDLQVIDPSLTPDAPTTVIQQAVRMLRQFGFELTSVIGGSFLRKSDVAAKQLGDALLTSWYFASPRIVAVRQIATIDASGVADTRQEVDILRNVPAAVAAPGQAARAPWVFRTLRGLVDSVLEQDVFADADGNGGSGSLVILRAALARPDVDLTVVTARNLSALDSIDLSAEAEARLATAALAGRVLFVPSRMTDVGGRPRVAWLELDPATGDAIAVSDDGAHAGVFVSKGSEEADKAARMGAFIRSNANPNAIKSFLGKTESASRQALARDRLRSYSEAQRTAVGVATIAAAVLEPALGINEGLAAFEETYESLKVANQTGEIIEETVDPPVGAMLFAFPPSPEFTGLAGSEADIVPHPLFGVPVGDALVPTVFKVGFRNASAATGTFSVAPSAVPPGFVATQSVPSVVVGPGEIGEVSVCLRPTSGVPPPGTPVELSVDVAGAGQSSGSSEQFTVPEVHAVELRLDPPLVAALPGVAAPATLVLRAAGNTTESVTLASTATPGLALDGLAPLVLAPGETATRLLSATPAAATPLDATLRARITADSGGAIVPATLLTVRVVAPGAQTAGDAASAAVRLGRPDLATTLDALASAIAGLVQQPDDAVARAQLLAALDALIAQAGADPALAGIVDALSAARAAVASAATPSDLQAALESLADALAPLAPLLGELGRHAFTLALSPAVAEARPQTPAQVQLVVRNTGTESSTYAFAVEGLPAGTTASFTPATLTLAPGEVAPRAGEPGVRLTLSPGATSDAVLPFVVRATVPQASAVQRTASGVLRLRDGGVSVLDVAATPAAVTAGTPARIATRVVSAVLTPRSAGAAFVLKDASGAVVRTGAPQPVQLGTQAALVAVDLGEVDTAGLADGSYGIEVALAETDGTPIAGATGRGTLLVGAPLTASLSVVPEVLPPGDGTVTTRLQVATSAAFTPPFTPRGFVDTDSPGEILSTDNLALHGTIAYACSTDGISIVDVSDPDAPVVVGAFASDLIDGVAGTACIVDGDVLYAVPTTGSGSRIETFALADPLHPQHVATIAVPYGFVSDVVVAGGHAFLTTNGVFFYLGDRNTIFRQFGDVVSVRLGAPTPGVADVLVNSAGPPTGGTTNFWQVARVTDDLVYVVGSTSQDGDTQIGSGRLLVLDVSDPAQLTVLKELTIPGTVQATGIAVQGARGLVAGNTGGWRNPFGPGFADYAFTGTTTLTSLDVSDPANPVLVGETLDTGFAPIAVSAFVYPAGDDRFALSGLAVDGAQAIALVDASDPLNLVVATAPIPSSSLRDPRGFEIDGARAYTASALGLAVFDVGEAIGKPYTAQVRVPRGTGVEVDPDGFSSVPNEVIAGPDFDTFLWRRVLAAGNTSQTIRFTSVVRDLAAGEVREVVAGATVAHAVAGAPESLALPPAAVLGKQVLTLDPQARTVAPGAEARYRVRIENPLLRDTVWQLDVAGVPEGWVTLDQSSVYVPGLSSVETDVVLRSEPLAEPGTYPFVVTATESEGARAATGGALVLDGAPVGLDLQPRGILVTIDPPLATAGRGSAAEYTVRLVNLGTRSETLGIQFIGFPSGIDILLDAGEVVVPPGADAARTFQLGLAPSTAAPGAYPFTLRVLGQGDQPATGEASAQLDVVDGGVEVAIAPQFGTPSIVFDLTVTNTGSREDTFVLALSGALATAASLAQSSVTLAPGASQQVPITLGALDFALPGLVELTATATAQGSPGTRDGARAFVELAGRRGVDAAFDPAAVALPAPGAALFLLDVQNVGNLDDSFRASITATTGPVTAALRGVSDEPTSTIERFLLPGLGLATIPLDATLTAPGSGTVTVRIESVESEGVFVEATAILGSDGVATPSPTAAPTPSVGPTPSSAPTVAPTIAPTVRPTPTGTPSATPTPTPDLTPTPTSTASDGSRGDVKCYAVRSKTGTPRFPGIPGVRLTDAFESIVATLVREERLCNPVAIDAAPVLDPATHLACYTLRPDAGEALVVPPETTIENRFGVQRIRFRGNSNDRGVCVPAAAQLAGAQGAPPRDGDALRCRRVRSVPAAGLEPATEVVLGDAFESKRMRVRRIESLCVPVTRDGRELDDPSSWLACYQVAQVPRQAAFQPPGAIEMSSDLGAQTVVVRNGQRVLCVPTQRR